MPKKEVTDQVEEAKEKKATKTSAKPKVTAKTKTKDSAEAAPKKKVKKEAAGGETLQLRLVKSGIGRSKDQKATIAGLGFKKVNQVVTLKDSPAVRGMVNKISHLVEIQ